MRSRRSSRTGLVAAACFIALAMPASGAAPTPKSHDAEHERAEARCDGAVQHPLSFKAVALDPLRRGATVRIRVTAGTQRELKRAEVRMISTGGAAAEGTTRSALGTLRAGRAASADFAVRLPDQGRRFLLEFRVSGEGAGGLESRGGVLNLLPDGPADPGRLVSSASGATVVEYRARRIGR